MSGLCNMRKEPHSDDVTILPTPSAENLLLDHPLTPPCLSANETAANSPALTSVVPPVPHEASGVAGGLADMLDAMGQDNSDAPSSSDELIRICTLTSECLLLIKTRYKQQYRLKRWVIKVYPNRVWS